FLFKCTQAFRGLVGGKWCATGLQAALGARAILALGTDKSRSRWKNTTIFFVPRRPWPDLVISTSHRNQHINAHTSAPAHRNQRSKNRCIKNSTSKTNTLNPARPWGYCRGA